MAGEVSKDLTRRMLLPQEIVDAHEASIIHFHDSDYYAQHMRNCDLVNLEDMLQNGTVISGTLIEKPHSFSTACNIATQIIAQIASNQYGGQSISLTHLAPFVDVSRQKIRKAVLEELKDFSTEVSDEAISKVVEKRLRDEIRRGVQTIQYQVVTLMTTNGQAPFITVFMYLGEARQEQKDLAIIIEETLNQRIEGVKNEKGVWITPAFPKLIYVLEEDNITEGSKFWYLTKLAARCTAKRMVPDYISEKKMKELKLSKGETPGHGDVYTCMGCRSFLTPDRSGNGWNNVANAGNYEPGKPKYYGRFNQGVVTINLVAVALSSGGAISYMEVPNMQNNIDAVLEVMKFIYDHIMYAELNTKSDYCQVCGFDGEIEIKEDPDGKLVWICPQCGNTDQSKMNVARRTCGYIGTQYWNQGRTQEIRDRVLHLLASPRKSSILHNPNRPDRLLSGRFGSFASGQLHPPSLPDRLLRFCKYAKSAEKTPVFASQLTQKHFPR